MRDPDTRRTVAEIGERALIARLKDRLAPAADPVVIGVGDDAAVVEPPRGELDVLTTDTLVEGVHFDRRFCSPGDVGVRALTVNLSDLAAMGAQPRLALLSMGLPDSFPVAAFDECLEAFLGAAAAHGVTLVGGNLTRTPGPWFLDVTAIGAARRRRVLTRSGGRPDDELYVTGTLGAARAGLAWLMRHADAAAPPAGGEAMDAAIARYRRPEPRVRCGLRAAWARAASGCMDLSDGLADAATQIAEASGTGVEIDLASLPVDPAVPVLWPATSAWEALLGGDDYELLFVVPPRRRRAFLAALSQGRRVGITCIGRLVPEADGRRVRQSDGSVVPLPQGYEHFA